MRYIVSEYTEDTNTGSMSQDEEWTFDTYEEAKEYFDESELEYSFRCELECSTRRKMKHIRFVCDLMRENDCDPWREVIDSKCVTLADIDD